MKAMVLRAPNDLVADDVAVPAADPARDVVVRVTHSGICGTDFKIYSGAIPVSYPRIMGHEMIGEVVSAGNGAVSPGDRVIVDPELYCGACFHCRIGQTHLCPNGMLLGRDANGGFADYVAAPATHVFRLPGSIDIARFGGRLLLFGIITAKDGALPFYDLYFKELALVGARVARSEDYPASLALVEKGIVRLEPLISDVMPLAELKQAIGMLGTDDARRMKIIMEHSRKP